MKVFVFGSRDVYSVPENAEQLIKQLEARDEGVEYIVGDCSGADAELQKCICRNGGMSHTTVYCAEYARHNIFDLPTKVFNFNGSDEVVSQYDKYKYKDMQMCKDCDMGIALWDGKSKGSFSNITRLKALDKPVYVFKV